MINNKVKFLNFFRNISKLKIFESVICRLTQNKPLASLIARVPANYYQYPVNSIRKVQRNNIWFELDISDYMEWIIYFGIQVEPREKLYSLSKNASVVFDIGANIGETTLNFVNHISENGIIHSFEPDENCYKKLLHNISINNFSNIRTNNFGLGNEEGAYYLASDTHNNKGGNRVLVDSNKPDNIYIKRMDDYVKSEHITNIDLIKIDVEGFEFNVLKGAEKTIVEFRPTLFIELNDNNLKEQKSSARELILFLEKYYSIIKDALTNELITSESEFTNCHLDIIAFK